MPSITEHHLAVTKTARYALLGDLDRQTTDLWVVCHGFGQLARDFLQEFQPIARKGRAIVAPEGLSRFYKSQGTVHTPATPVGATWMTSEDRETEISDYVAYLDALLAHLRPLLASDVRITALGFSQGVATVSRWVARSRPDITRLILWGGLVPPEIGDAASAAGLTGQPLFFVHGSTDKYFNAALIQSEMARLSRLGIAFTPTEFNGGHVIARETLEALGNV